MDSYLNSKTCTCGYDLELKVMEPFAILSTKQSSKAVQFIVSLVLQKTFWYFFEFFAKRWVVLLQNRICVDVPTSIFVKYQLKLCCEQHK